MTEIVDLEQGSDEWHAFRRQHFNASDAAIVMDCAPSWWGISTKKELKAYMDGGDRPEVSDFVKRMQRKGHEKEAEVRAMLSTMDYADYQPVVVKDGDFAASLDGWCTASKRWIEVKSPKSVTSKVYRDADDISSVSEHHWYQLVHQAHVLEGMGYDWGCTYIVAPPDGKMVILHFTITELLDDWGELNSAWERFRGYNEYEATPTDRTLAENYINAVREHEIATDALETAKAALLEDGIRDIPGYVSMKQITIAGRVDYKRIATQFAPDADLEEYREPTSIRTTIKIEKGEGDE